MSRLRSPQSRGHLDILEEQPLCFWAWRSQSTVLDHNHHSTDPSRFVMIVPALRAGAVRQAVPRASAIQTRGLLNSVLYGSEQAKKEGELEIQQYSRLIGRGKYIHGPDKVEEYKKAAEKHYTGLLADSDLHVKLTGSWEVTVGKLDTFESLQRCVPIRSSSHVLAASAFSHVSRPHPIRESEAALRPYLLSRNQQLCQEFAFLPSSPPHEQGGIFELRSYTLQPGSLLEWENVWRSGIEARKQFVKPVGAWFSQVGRLHEVHHLWQYPDLETRKLTRERAWKVDGWSDTVHKPIFEGCRLDHWERSIALIFECCQVLVTFGIRVNSWEYLSGPRTGRAPVDPRLSFFEDLRILIGTQSRAEISEL
ncbi:NIPSNAP domain-containing protein [Rhizoctonia solani AG-1 IA]|uniref:NIPSNAP domain-containing protein n=1 Tax=Thanatephorus cucumeris (strain AG1-IA) TaxID=983506 RepID=L8WMR5_THACA|nr:NIPSNAP domain-containing protein [Rhizoctonia solani AG-1 IA]